MNGVQRLARAERDCVDLHQALTTAIRRLVHARRMYGSNALVSDPATDALLATADLEEVLDRTSQPSIEVIPAGER